MSKQVLDLYELYRLVCEKGGVLEVINKKLWQDIIKRLRLPSSITSAAFTLRTQYIKYLYPYECEKRNFSDPSELKAVVEGNKRERDNRNSFEDTRTHISNNMGIYSNSSPLNNDSVNSLLGGFYPTPVASNDNLNPLLGGMFNGFDQSPLALLTRRNLMLQYMQMMETQQNPETTCEETKIEEDPSTTPRIKREHPIRSNDFYVNDSVSSSYLSRRTIPNPVYVPHNNHHSVVDGNISSNSDEDEFNTSGTVGENSYTSDFSRRLLNLRAQTLRNSNNFTNQQREIPQVKTQNFTRQSSYSLDRYLTTANLPSLTISKRITSYFKGLSSFEFFSTKTTHLAF
uniref:ARID domain-containing protein n=1 Tax=Megaselia scalaris TaxID=36166 RepID=T1GDD0_MEGSC